MCLLVNAQVFSVLAQRAAWLYSPPRSGFGYILRKARWDPRLAQALRGVVNPVSPLAVLGAIVKCSV